LEGLMKNNTNSHWGMR